jgi:hypothetical protein
VRRAISALGLGLALAAAPAPASADVHGVPLPKGSKADAGGARHASSKGYRDTVDHVRKWLERQGLAHRQVGPYRARGVDVTRFVSTSEATPWLAIHVWRAAGKTWISVVARPKDPPLDDAAPAE